MLDYSIDSTASKIVYLCLAYVCNKLSPMEEIILREWRLLSAKNESIFQELTSPETQPELHEEVRRMKKLT
jgi:hypothetical protein